MIGAPGQENGWWSGADLFALTITGLFGLFVFSGCGDQVPEPESKVPIVVITDMEPDDRIALHLLVALFPERVSLIGTTVMHSYRKKVLAERLMRQLNMSHIPVIQGSGGYAEDYPEIASSRAGREYDLEGMDILDQRALQDMANQARSSKQLLASQAFPISLYSSHVVKKFFSGGSLERATFPRLIEMLEASSDSRIELVEVFDEAVFREVFVDAFEALQ